MSPAIAPLWDDDEWEVCNDDGFIYKRRRRPALPEGPSPTDIEAELQQQKRARKWRCLRAIRDKYQREIDQWEGFSASLTRLASPPTSTSDAAHHPWIRPRPPLCPYRRGVDQRQPHKTYGGNHRNHRVRQNYHTEPPRVPATGRRRAVVRPARAAAKAMGWSAADAQHSGCVVVHPMCTVAGPSGRLPSPPAAVRLVNAWPTIDREATRAAFRPVGWSCPVGRLGREFSRSTCRPPSDESHHRSTPPPLPVGSPTGHPPSLPPSGPP
ncbi:hypothetical protein KSP40_PGU019628 [Platanthera guangdongensis]|uniref:Uncharacterized protein n=1 Tax=Platanthera guangdongensis TaxID=2320717 RepID=A0ABR2MRB0_9ASPA